MTGRMLRVAFVAGFALSTVAVATEPELDLDFMNLPAIEIEAEAPADAASNVVRVGDTLRLKSTLDMSVLPEEAQTALKNAQGRLVWRVPPGTTALSKQGWILRDPRVDASGTLWFEAIAVGTGKITIPALALDLLLKKTGAEQESAQALARTLPFTVEVQSVLQQNPKAEPPPALPPVGLPVPWLEVGLVGAPILFLLVLALWRLIRWIQKRRRAEKPAAVIAVPVRPAHERALAALEDLQRRDLWKSGAHKEHYFGVSEILKKYFGERYGFDAPECTSAELVAQLERRRGGLSFEMSEETIGEIAHLFARLDQVKFTDHVPEGVEAVAVVTDAIRIVRATQNRDAAPILAAGGAS